MKALLPALIFMATACCGTKKQTAASVADGPNAAGADSILVSIPSCIDSLIAVFKKEEVKNPPRKIYQYSYRDKTVYYVPAICCDFFSDLYDDHCNLIGHPDGGYTGRGDGRLPDFQKEKKNEMLVWEDKRGNSK